MNFGNNSQVKNINKELSKLSDLLATLEGSTSLNDFVLAQNRIEERLDNLRANIDTIDRKWIKKDVVQDMDNRVAQLVRRYNLAKTRTRSYYKDLSYVATDVHFKSTDVASRNEVRVSDSPKAQKILKKKRVKAVVKEVATLALVGTMLGGLVFGGVKLNNTIKERDQATAQVGVLQDENLSQEARIAELLIKISALENELANNGNLSDSEREALQAEIDRLEAELAKAYAENETLKNENQDLTDRNAKLEAQIKLLKSDLKKSNALVDSLRQQLAANPDSAELKAQLAEALAENEVLKAQNEALTLENEELKAQITTLNSNYNTLKAENEKLDSENSALLKTNAGLKAQVDLLNAEVDELEGTIDDLNIEIGNLTAALNAANGEIARLQAIIDKGDLSAAERAEYEARIKTLRESNASLEEKLKTKTDEYNTLLGEYEEVTAEKDALLEENAGLKSENEDLRAQVEENKELVEFIDNYYLETMGNSGNGLSATEKLVALFAYFTEAKPTSEDYQKLEAVYAFLTQIYGPSDIVYGSLTLAEFEAVLDQLAGGLQAQPGDEPSGPVNEGTGNQGGSNNGGTTEQPEDENEGGTVEEIEDGRFPGDK